MVEPAVVLAERLVEEPVGGPDVPARNREGHKLPGRRPEAGDEKPGSRPDRASPCSPSHPSPASVITRLGVTKLLSPGQAAVLVIEGGDRLEPALEVGRSRLESSPRNHLGSIRSRG